MAFSIKKTPAYSGVGGLIMKGEGGGMRIKATTGGPTPPTSIQPDSISGLKLWYKADAITGLSNNASVTSWPDSSGNGKNLGVAYSAPTYKSSTAIFNNMPTVYFAGGAPNWNSLIAYSTGAPQGSAARTWYFVWSVNTGAGHTWGLGQGDASWDGGSTGNGLGVYVSSGTPTVAMDITNDLNPDSPVAYTANTAKILSFPYVAGSALDTNPMYLDGVAQSLGANSNVLSTVNDTFTVGHHDNDGDQGMTGHVAEVIVYDTAHDDTTRQGIEQYLATKYGVSI